MHTTACHKWLRQGKDIVALVWETHILIIHCVYEMRILILHCNLIMVAMVGNATIAAAINFNACDNWQNRFLTH